MSEAVRHLAAQRYPGNVRELENVVERAVTLARSDVVGLVDVAGEAAAALGHAGSPPSIPAEGLDLDAHLAWVERTLLLDALERAEGNRTRAAKLLGMTFRSLRYRLQKYDIGEGVDDAGADEDQDEEAPG